MLLLKDTNRPAEAEPLYRRALAIGEASLGPDHPSVAIRLNNLAQLLQDTKRPAEAEPLMRRALAIWEKSLGVDHPSTQTAQANLEVLLAQKVSSAAAGGAQAAASTTAVAHAKRSLFARLFGG